MTSFQSELNKNRLLVENKIDEILFPKYPHLMYEAMNYTIKAGGKRIRALLLIGAAQAFSGMNDTALNFACAIEMIHNYSLIHDDLPALDNDDLRRGKPTNHKVFGEAIAVLAGDALLNTAYEVMAKSCSTSRHIQALQIIAKSAGVDGMIGGQTVDILSEGKKIDKGVLTYIHKSKTAALLQAAVTSGAILGGASSFEVENISEAGLKLGIAFQIKDDILDVTSTVNILGKPINSDEKNQKSTYVSLFGLEQAEKDYSDLSDSALELFKQTTGSDGFVIELVKELSKRMY